MPLISASDYVAPRLFQSGHVQTVVPKLFRRVDAPPYRRERFDTPDGDFLDLDWMRRGTGRLAILSHGLGGGTHRSYMRGMARTLFRQAWDVLAWNYRGCSGEPNRLLRSYHSGATDDLDLVVQHALAQGYRQVALVGFSLGGNLVLKYAGERGTAVDPRIGAVVAFSVPCDLAAGCQRLEERANWLYHQNFMVALRAVLRAKQQRFADAFDFEALDHITTLRAFDDWYTAPVHGFRDAADYYARCSSKPFLPDIRIPTLVVNAADDPFLPPACFPVAETQHHPYVHLEVPSRGGHIGFVAFNEQDEFWSERRAARFLNEVLGTIPQHPLLSHAA